MLGLVGQAYQVVIHNIYLSDSTSEWPIRGGIGYFVGGTTFSFENGQRDFWLFKIDDSGKVLWSCTVGRSNYEEAYVVLLAAGNVHAENEFFMAGWTNSVGEGRYDFYAVTLAVEP
jgi:hypothetical protein